MPRFPIAFSRFATLAGTYLSIGAPNAASSFTREAEMNRNSGAVMRYTISISAASERFMFAISNSNSKSESARIPRTMKLAPDARANSTCNPSKLDLDVLVLRAGLAHELDALLVGKDGLLREVAADANDNAIEQARRALDDVE